MSSWPAPGAVPNLPVPASPTPPSRVESVVGRRVAAVFIDLVPLTVVVVALSDRVGSHGTLALNLSGIRFFLALVVVLAYYFVTEALTATSPGKRLRLGADRRYSSHVGCGHRRARLG